MTLQVESPTVYTSQGVPISVTGIAQVIEYYFSFMENECELPGFITICFNLIFAERLRRNHYRNYVWIVSIQNCFQLGSFISLSYKEFC